MFNFVAQRPTKQGTKYGLNLGQNDGPYLPKDMMLNNQKSLQLLVGTHITRSSTAFSIPNSTTHASIYSGKDMLNHFPPNVYDEKLGAYTTYDEKFKSQLTASESIGINSSFQSAQMRKLKELLQQYKDIIHEYKEELKGMNRRINEANQLGMGDLQPAMRRFYDQLKTELQDTKNENYQLQREAEQLNRDKMQIQQQINFSEKRIQELEKFMGVSAKLDESDISENIDF